MFINIHNKMNFIKKNLKIYFTVVKQRKKLLFISVKKLNFEIKSFRALFPQRIITIINYKEL